MEGFGGCIGGGYYIGMVSMRGGDWGAGCGVWGALSLIYLSGFCGARSEGMVDGWGSLDFCFLLHIHVQQ